MVPQKKAQNLRIFDDNNLHGNAPTSVLELLLGDHDPQRRYDKPRKKQGQPCGAKTRDHQAKSKGDCELTFAVAPRYLSALHFHTHPS